MGFIPEIDEDPNFLSRSNTKDPLGSLSTPHLFDLYFAVTVT